MDNTVATTQSLIHSHLLNDTLLDMGLVSHDILHQAQELNSADIGSALISMGVLSEQQLFQTYQQVTGLMLWDVDGDLVSDERFEGEFLATNNILPVRLNNQSLLVIDDPLDDGLIDMLKRMASDTKIAITPHADLALSLQKHPQIADCLDDSEHLEETNERLDTEHLKDLALEAPIIRQVNDIINNAVHIQASDIHFEPFRHRIELRFRVDGALLPRSAPSAEEYPAVVSRIKIMSDMDIAERRLPQDGRFRHRSGGREIDIRVSTMPTPYGEDIVLRILDKRHQVLSLDECGLSPAILTEFRSNLKKPNGIMLVTGPTGSGKTTTLYSALQEMIDGERKIITVEDPVEYEIAGITQIPVNEAIGMSFSTALRSILRHDPDIIFIGEIRDQETAEIAIQAALTGHLVLSTLHTNQAIGAVTRFLEMGIPDYLLASSLLAVSAQRLVRQLCSHCKTEATIPGHFAERFKLSPTQIIYQANGCHKCTQTGFHGRRPIAEFKQITPVVRTAIVQDPSFENLEKAAHQSNPKTLLDDGIEAVLKGQTTFDEIMTAAG